MFEVDFHPEERWTVKVQEEKILAGFNRYPLLQQTHHISKYSHQIRMYKKHHLYKDWQRTSQETITELEKLQKLLTDPENTFFEEEPKTICLGKKQEFCVRCSDRITGKITLKHGCDKKLCINCVKKIVEKPQDKNLICRGCKEGPIIKVQECY